MKKGMSPLVASVLLLAVTLSVASIFSGWGPEVIRMVTDETMNTTQRTIDCNQAGLTIESARFDGASETAVVVRNTGSADLDGVHTSAWIDNLPVDDTVTSIESGNFTRVDLNTGDKPDEVQAVSQKCSDVRDSEEQIN